MILAFKKIKSATQDGRGRERPSIELSLYEHKV